MASTLGDELRLDYVGCRDLLDRRLREPAPGRIQLLSGPRQVGKTTLLLELAGRLGESAIYAAADGPEAALPGFWEFARRFPGYRPLVVCDDAGRPAAERAGFESLGWRDFLLDGLRRA